MSLIARMNVNMYFFNWEISELFVIRRNLRFEAKKIMQKEIAFELILLYIN